MELSFSFPPLMLSITGWKNSKFFLFWTALYVCCHDVVQDKSCERPIWLCLGRETLTVAGGQGWKISRYWYGRGWVVRFYSGRGKTPGHCWCHMAKTRSWERAVEQSQQAKWWDMSCARRMGRAKAEFSMVWNTVLEEVPFSNTNVL